MVKWQSVPKIGILSKFLNQCPVSKSILFRSFIHSARCFHPSYHLKSTSELNEWLYSLSSFRFVCFPSFINPFFLTLYISFIGPNISSKSIKEHRKLKMSSIDSSIHSNIIQYIVPKSIRVLSFGNEHQCEIICRKRVEDRERNDVFFVFDFSSISFCHSWIANWISIADSTISTLFLDDDQFRLNIERRRRKHHRRKKYFWWRKWWANVALMTEQQNKI